jgi:putative DNA methylase
MEAGIVARLRDFWDAGIRGPDFVWAATGPALEAYSRYPAVKKASETGQLMTVTEFLVQHRGNL